VTVVAAMGVEPRPVRALSRTEREKVIYLREYQRCASVHTLKIVENTGASWSFQVNAGALNQQSGAG
jgi:hypothetical protein